jgi:pyruvate kinase
VAVMQNLTPGEDKRGVAGRLQPGIGTKIIATIGPASRDRQTLADLVAAGVDGFRINCSHTPREAIEGIVRDVRSVGNSFVMADLAGLKLRTREKLAARAGGEVVISYDALNHRVTSVEVGAEVAFGDGTNRGKVVWVSGTQCGVAVEEDLELPVGGAIHLSGAHISGSCMEEHDRADMEAAIAAGCDWIALSYVRDGEDAAGAVALVAGRAGVIAKIERVSAIDDLAGICDHVDAIMIARGDLGVDMPYARVPAAQRSIYRYCRSRGVPVVCATEMMQSMITSTRPTRAEVGDVEAVIRYGYDAILLTAETAMGKHPVLVVQTAAEIRAVAEPNVAREPGDLVETDVEVATAAVALADRTKASAIVALTSTGRTAKTVVGARPTSPVYAVSDSPEIARRVGLYHGVRSFVAPRHGGVEESGAGILRALVAAGEITSGDVCILVGSRVGPDQDADVVMIRVAD